MKSSFRQRSARAVYEAHQGPNMTPMVDVVMVILIFFMASTAIVGPEWFVRSSLPVVAPATANDPDQPPTRLRIVLEKGGVARVALDDAEPRATPMFQVEDVLRQELAARGPDRLIVLVEPAPDASYDDVVRVHEWCARLGISRVGLHDTPQAE